MSQCKNDWMDGWMVDVLGHGFALMRLYWVRKQPKRWIFGGITPQTQDQSLNLSSAAQHTTNWATAAPMNNWLHLYIGKGIQGLGQPKLMKVGCTPWPVDLYTGALPLLQLLPFPPYNHDKIS